MTASLGRLIGRVVARGICISAAAASLAACTKPPVETVAEQWGLLDTYCTGCHNDDDLDGGLSLLRRGPDNVAQHPEVWEKVVRKLRGDLMPPPGERRPEAVKAGAFAAALEKELDASAAARGVDPGRVAMHRLNRTEYQTAVENLLGVHFDARAMLPPDVASGGFDNVAEALRVSPTHLEQYIAAARDVSAKAVGSPHSEPVRSEYRSNRANRTTHVDGLPLGTRGGLLVEHYFPADGAYVFNVDVSSVPASDLRAYPNGWLEYRHRVILTIDDQKVFEGELGGEDDLRAMDQQQITAVNAIKERFRGIRVSVKAGYRKVGATFVARSHAESDYRLSSFVPGETVPDVPLLHGLEVVGPYDASGISESTSSRDRIFSCHPDTAEQEPPCALAILTNLARGAFRRPVTDADVEPLLAFYRSGREKGDFEAGIKSGLTAMLVSTKFLYRAEPGGPPAGLAPGSAYPIEDLELAWRLAFFLWSSGPDEQLLELAEQGKLADSGVYEQQVRRMLADPKSKSLVTNFAFQWLTLRRLKAIDPDPKLYPYFDADLRAAFESEMELFLDSILRRPGGSVLELLTAKHTFMNERLARHYGVGGIRGDQFRRVELDDPNRFGLLGKAGVLMVTSYPDRTSPVLRGAWIMEHLLGTPPAPVPAGVETDLTPEPGDQPRSVRERLERHRKSPSCNHCHGVIDPLGQPLESFSPIGEWRVVERESGVTIDSRGRLAGGRDVATPVDLREALTAKPDLFVQALTEKLLTYALGRNLQYYDMPTVRAIVADAAAHRYEFATLVMGIANSKPFKMRVVPEPAAANAVAAAADTSAEGEN